MSGAPPPPPPPPPSGFVVARPAYPVPPISEPAASFMQPVAPPPVPAPAPAPAAPNQGLAALAGFSAAPVSNGPVAATPVSNPAPAASSVSSASTSPALTAIRNELNVIFDWGRAAYDNNKELKSNNKKVDPDGRLTSMVNRLWYRMAYLINGKYQGTGSDLTKEVMMACVVLCEVRQTVVDVFELSKFMGDKVSVIVARHAWLFDTARKLEDLVGRMSMKLASVDSKTRVANTYIPQLIDAPVCLFEDRLANYTFDQQQVLFEECGNLKSLRTQVESYLNQELEPALILLFVTEAVGKAVGVLLPQKEKRKLYFASLLSTYSVCRANSWMLMKANHGIDLGKTGSKLGVSQSVSAAASANEPAPVPGLASVSAADLLRQNTVANSSVRSLPTEANLQAMMTGLVLTGYFQAPNLDEPVVQKMLVYYDLVTGTAASPADLVGKPGALFWQPDTKGLGVSARHIKSADCSLPIAALTDILTGKQTKVFQTVVGSRANPGCCVTLVSKDGFSMNFEAASKEALTTWLSLLTKLASASGKKMSEASDHAAPSAAAAPPSPALAPIVTPAPAAPAVTSAAQVLSSPPLLSSTSTSTSYAVAAAAAAAAATSTSPVSSELDSVAALVDAAAPAAATSAVNGGWIRCTAPDGNYYFYNATLATSVWEKPAEYVDESVDAVQQQARELHF